MQTLTSKTKELKDLEPGDKLVRLFDKQTYPIAEIVNCADSLDMQKNTYYYFRNMGYVKEKVMKKMFKTVSDGFVINKEG